MRSYVVPIILLIVFVVGCSGGSSPATPDLPTPADRASSANSHTIWGYWQGIIDPDAQTIEFIQLRSIEFHLNALPFLEPPAMNLLSLDGLQFNGDIIDADIGLRHPFLGLTEFTGFDVCGVFISNGSVSGYTDTGIMMAGDGDTCLLNPDGYGRFWNPAEFPINTGTIFGYTDGLLGAPDSFGDFNSTLNGYKYYCDDLSEITSTMADVTQLSRGMFSAGQKNVRRFTIQIGNEGLVFNYAVDASWMFPNGDPPYQAPDDFPLEANRTEAWWIQVTELDNTLYNDGVDSGGDLSLQVDVYDWMNAELNTVRIESLGNITMTEAVTPFDTGAGFSSYQIDIIDATPEEGQIDLLISVISEEPDFQGFIPGTNTAAYFTYTADVSIESPASYHWEYDTIATFAPSYYGNPASQDFDDISPAIVDEGDNDIFLTWAGTDTNEVWNGIDSVFWLYRSTDNGVTYNYHNFGDSGGENLPRADRNKICKGNNNDSYAMSTFGPPNGWAYVVWTVDPWGTSNRGVFVSYPLRDLEVFQDSTGYIYCFDDDVGNIEMKHSTAPNTLDYWTWHDSGMYPTYTVATQAYCSHVRSAGEDSTGVVWLALYNTGESQIRLSHSTDSSPHEAWDDSTVVYDAVAGVSQVKSPCLMIDGADLFHVCYTRYNSANSSYQLVYTTDDSSFGNPTEEIIVESANPINDNHFSLGQKFGKDVLIFSYETGDSIYLITYVGGNVIGPPEEIDDTSDDIDPDAILDSDQCDLHFVWSTMNVDNYDIARRNGVLIED